MVVVQRRSRLVIGRTYVYHHIAMDRSTTYGNCDTSTQKLGNGQDRQQGQSPAKTGGQQFFQGKSPGANKYALGGLNVGKQNNVDIGFAKISPKQALIY
jgi:hypothetical protein